MKWCDRSPHPRQQRAPQFKEREQMEQLSLNAFTVPRRYADTKHERPSIKAMSSWR